MTDVPYELNGGRDAFDGDFKMAIGDGSRAVRLTAVYRPNLADVALRGRSLTLTFGGIESFKVSYLHAVNVDVVWNAADRVIDIGRSEYLTETEMHLRLSGGESTGLRHLVFYPGGETSYEFICRDFDAELG